MMIDPTLFNARGGGLFAALMIPVGRTLQLQITPGSFHSPDFCFSFVLAQAGLARPFKRTSSAEARQKKTRRRPPCVGLWRAKAERGGFEPPVQLPIRQFSKLLV